MWTSSVLVEPHQFSSHTSSISCSRVTTTPAASAPARSSTSNSFGRNAISVADEDHPPGGDVDGEVAEVDRWSPWRPGSRARRAPRAMRRCERDPGQQLGQPERLDDVVDGAHLEAEHDVDLLGRGRSARSPGPSGARGRRARRPPRRRRRGARGRAARGRAARRRATAMASATVPVVRRVVAVRPQGAHEAGRDQRVVLDHQHGARHVLHTTDPSGRGAVGSRPDRAATDVNAGCAGDGRSGERGRS